MKEDNLSLNLVLNVPTQARKKKTPRKKNKYEKRRRLAKSKLSNIEPGIPPSATINHRSSFVSCNVGEESNSRVIFDSEKNAFKIGKDAKTVEGENNIENKISKGDLTNQKIEKEREGVKNEEKRQVIDADECNAKDKRKGYITDQEIEKLSIINKKEQEQKVFQSKASITQNEHLQQQESAIENEPNESAPFIGKIPSRKNQLSVTTQVLQDVVKRAEYMSTYHARPHEMDRRSGAMSHIRKSQESFHIFGNDGDVPLSGGEKECNCQFARCGLHPRVINAITSSKGLNLKRPTMIQQNTWMEMLKNGNDSKGTTAKNFSVQSETGSGKTLAYFIPILQSLAIEKNSNKIKRIDRNIGGTRAIIICPTRELTIQTYKVTEKISQSAFPWLVTGCLSGGEKRKSEKARLRKGISILVATPGRLLDHLEKTDCLLVALKGKLEWFVLDESDRLLDMGLGSQVEHIIQILGMNQKITWRSALISATLTDEAKELAKKLLGGNKWVSIPAKNAKGLLEDTHQEKEELNPETAYRLSGATPVQLTQHHMIVSAKLRLPALIAFLVKRIQKMERVVIFMSTCDSVDFHHKLFTNMKSIVKDGKKNTSIFSDTCLLYRLHGNVPHKERHDIISQFSKTNIGNKESAVLMTTDVAARGLNLPAVDWIVQYDPPCETSDYVHRAGRTARAGNAGHALLFLLPSESQYVEVLKLRGVQSMMALSLAKTLQGAAETCPDLTCEGAEISGHGQGVKGSRAGESFACALQARLEDCIVKNDVAYKNSLSKKILSIGGDKQQRRQEKKEAKHATGPLLESARKAYTSYIRGYSTKEKAVKHIFNARALHLGHVARSFALKEQPKALSKANRRDNNNTDNDQILKSTGEKRNHRLAFGQGKLNEEVSDTTVEKQNHKSLKKNQRNNLRNDAPLDSIDPRSLNNLKFSAGRIKAKMIAAAKRLQDDSMDYV